MTDESLLITVTCKGCGAEYTMPNIGKLVTMDNCPSCPEPDPITRLRAGKPVGKRRQFISHFEQDIMCAFVDKKVTLVTNKNGLIVCRIWKKCPHHAERLVVPGKGETACPETQYRELLAKQRKERHLR